MNHNCPYLEMQCQNLKCDCPKYKAYIDAKNPEIFRRVMEENKFDVTLPAFDLLMKMQYSFASRVRKVDDLSKEEKDKWIDRYLVCIEDEIREVREHLNLYGEESTKKEDQNFELKKEVIDILHFVMELFLVGGANQDTIKSYYSAIYGSELNGDLIDVAYAEQKNFINEYLDCKHDKYDIAVLKASCRLSDSCALVRQQISWKHWKKPNAQIDYEKLYSAFAKLFHEFINLCILTMKVNEVKDIYINKNVENILRQEYGY